MQVEETIVALYEPAALLGLRMRNGVSEPCDHELNFDLKILAHDA